MKKGIKTILIIINLLLIIGVIFYILDIGKEDNDWWTKVFCNIEDGALDNSGYYDTCVIEGDHYRAKFKGTGRYHNLTSLGEIKEWQLKKVRDK